MAILIVPLLLLLASPIAHASIKIEPAGEVIYDYGNAQQSVGVIGAQIVEAGDLYRDYHVLTFEPQAIVLRSSRDHSGLKWPVDPNFAPSPKLKSRALKTFIAVQMKAIHQAQMRYFEKFPKRYAPNLEELIRQGFLADGFEDWKKQGYQFEVAEVKEEYGKDPTFLAVASPGEELEELPFFSVDHLGLVRMADTKTQVAWGPVWDYMDHSGGPPQKSFKASDEEDL